MKRWLAGLLRALFVPANTVDGIERGPAFFDMPRDADALKRARLHQDADPCCIECGGDGVVYAPVASARHSAWTACECAVAS